MKVGGIIAEYNPFHNGHKYQLERFKKDYNLSHVVVILSGNFMQRGDVAIVDKFKRSMMAIEGGADLVIELPVVYSLATAEYFALGGIYILDALKCVDYLSFGSSSDIISLQKIVELLEDIRNSAELIEMMETGLSFPIAIRKIVNEQYGIDLSSILDDSNNVLGLEYIRALNRLHSNIQPTTITRMAVEHDSNIPINEYASASYIRKCILTRKNYTAYVPSSVYTDIKMSDYSTLSNLEKPLLYKLRMTTVEQLRNVFDVSHGLEYRIIQATKNSTTLNDLLFNIKTKRYTLARIRRILLNLLIGITKDDLKILPPYARILAMNSQGIEILSNIKRLSTIPFGTSLAKLENLSNSSRRFAFLESTATDLYGLSGNTIHPCGEDYIHQIKVLPK